MKSFPRSPDGNASTSPRPWQHSILVSIVLFALCIQGYAQQFRIVVAGDGRAQYPWRDKRPEEDVGGLNVAINREICRAVLNERPQIMLWTGDIVNVNETAGKEDDQKTCALKCGLKMWREIINPLLENHIKVLPVRGNHEVHWHEQRNTKPIYITSASAAWKEVLSDLVPDNGPENEKGLSFWYAEGPVLCIGLDQYENRRHSINTQWLHDVLAKNTAELKKPFIFAFGHEPAFATGGHHGQDETLAADPPKRNEMLQSLWDAGARVYFCGHDHFYDHLKAVRPMPSGSIEIHQVTAGTAGAPNYAHERPCPVDQGWMLEQRELCDLIYGYVLISIEGNQATVEFKGRESNGEYQVKDSFSYTSAGQ